MNIYKYRFDSLFHCAQKRVNLFKISLEDEDFSVLEASQQSKSLVQQILALDLSKQPTYTQTLVGGAAGW